MLYPQLAPSDVCSASIRVDWPTRQNDLICTQKALAVCMQPGCEAALCVVHAEQCEKCKQEFCEGCYSLHMEECK
jgi:hypothetical protein